MCIRWDKEDLQSYPWENNYMTRDEILKYLNHVVDKYSLRKHMQFKTELISATWENGHWRARCSTGDVFVTKYLITSLGLLTKPNYPDIPGLAEGSFKGKVIHSSAWDNKIDLTDKRVGIIGCGSTGTQLTTALAGQVKQLTCFIRNPQFTVPDGFRRVAEDERAQINEKYDAIWSALRQSRSAAGVPESSLPMMSVSKLDINTIYFILSLPSSHDTLILLCLSIHSYNCTNYSQSVCAKSLTSPSQVPPEERERILEDLWKQGNGFRFMFSGFGDITFNPEANVEVCKFLRRKIAEAVHDPATAAALTPRPFSPPSSSAGSSPLSMSPSSSRPSSSSSVGGPDEGNVEGESAAEGEDNTDHFYARRPVCDRGYYAAFNKPHVSAVDLRAAPITAVEAGGLRTADGALHELDVLVLATGYDAVDGAYRAVRGGITGRDGVALADCWRERPTSYLGVFVAGFPNLFLLNGPHSPFATQPLVLETEVDLVVAVLRELEARGRNTVEVTAEAQAEWVGACDAMGSYTLFNKMKRSWLTGSNTNGRKPHTMFYLGGMGSYSMYISKLNPLPHFLPLLLAPETRLVNRSPLARKENH